MWCTLWRHINRTSQRTTTRIVFTYCDENQYYSEIWEHSCSYNPTARQSDIPIVRQFDSPTEMCLFFTFTVQVRKQQSKNSRERYKVLVRICILVWRNLIVNFYNSMIISKWRTYNFRRAIIFFIKLNLFLFFFVKLFLKTVLAIYEPTGTIKFGYVFRV
jgi:hypothetical protein